MATEYYSLETEITFADYYICWKGAEMKRTKLEEEHVPACWICGKIWRRMNSEKWYYFNEMLVCKDHPGVLAWLYGSVEIVEEKIRLETQ